MHTYEPDDLDTMQPHQAVGAVLSDLREHRVTGDGDGLFTATRHIGLLCHLAARMASDIEYQLVANSSGLFTAQTLGETTGHLGQAIAHYTQALAPLAALAQPAAQAPLQQQADAIDRHRHLRVHLHDAGQALAAARACLQVPHHPGPPNTTTTAVAASAVAAVRRRA
ncbi:hypothetical protein ACIQPR_45980 [Streptomyces sp. NPDC091280]|uniref:hypothetical protein n=1 Tax=Streptomyces sp. NPDC091280 TaxID=3365984 RepID=UPI00380F5096